MNSSELHKKIHYILLCAIVATVSFSIKLNSFLIILCAINWVIEGNLVSKIKPVFTNKINFCWIIFFILHIISYFISTNQQEAGAILERRLAMAAFPFLVFGSVTPYQLKNIGYAFVIGVISALVFCYIKAFQHFVIDHQLNNFFYHQLTSAIKMNAVYMSAYVVFAIHILLFYINWKKQKIIAIALFSFLLFSCFMLSSKMMFLVLFLGLTVKAFHSGWIKNKIRLLLILITTTFVIVTTIALTPQIRDRFLLELTSDFSILQNEHYTYDTPFTGTSLRLRIWKFCIEILNEQNTWLSGVGTGDFQDLLNQKYTSTGIYIGNPKLHDTGYLGYGPHNEYIEILFSLGVPALLFFVFILTLLWKYAIKSNHYLLIQLLLICTLFFVTESVLSTNKGVIFFMFFTLLFLPKEQSLPEK